MTYLSEIARLTSSNIGGVVELKVARVDDIASMPNPDDDTIYGDINFKTGGGWHSWWPTSQTIGVSSQNADGMEGDYKMNSMPFIISKDRQGIKAMLDKAEQDDFIVLFKDGNGNPKIFGTIDRPVKFSFSQSTPEAHSSRNAYSCQFTYSGPDNIYFYDGAVPAAPSGPAPVVLKWNGVTIGTAQPGDTINIISEFVYDDFDITPTIS